MLQVGDMVSYRAGLITEERLYGIVVGFTHNDYYYIDWFYGWSGNTWTVPYHASTLSPVEATSESI